MAALQHLAEGQLSTPPRKTYAGTICLEPQLPPLKEAGLHRGKPAIFFSESEIQQLSKPFKFALVGKFSKGRPSMETLRKEMLAIGFKGNFTCGLLDTRHVLIRFDMEEDFHRCWLKRIWSFQGFIMRTFKWSSDFRVNQESPIVPVWIRFEHLPIHLFQKFCLFSIARLIGNPLKVDASTASLVRPSVARVCIELDLTKPKEDSIWIGNGKNGFWQEVVYENVPDYCHQCSKIGHLTNSCDPKGSNRRLNASHDVTVQPPSLEQQWRPKPLEKETHTQLEKEQQQRYTIVEPIPQTSVIHIQNEMSNFCQQTQTSCPDEEATNQQPIQDTIPTSKEHNSDGQQPYLQHNATPNNQNFAAQTLDQLQVINVSEETDSAAIQFPQIQHIVLLKKQKSVQDLTMVHTLKDQIVNAIVEQQVENKDEYLADKEDNSTEILVVSPNKSDMEEKHGDQDSGFVSDSEIQQVILTKRRKKKIKQQIARTIQTRQSSKVSFDIIHQSD